MKYEVILDRDSYHKMAEIMAWCEKHFGPRMIYDVSYSERWQVHEAFGNQFYRFANAEDAVLFKLKWS